MWWFVLVGATLPGCVVVVDPSMEVDEVRAVEAFSAVANDSRLDVEIAAGQAHGLVVHCDENKLDQIETTVVGGELRISTRSVGLFESWGQCYATVTTPSLGALSSAGSGDLTAIGDWPGLSSITSSGSGDMDAQGIDTDSLDLVVSGSGDLHATGVAQFTSVTLNGSGDVEADDLEATNADIVSNGSGDVSLWVSGAASVTLHGSGDVLLYGEPQVDIHDTGSGDVVLN
ncbi:MAG: head GIN domain-containing protein [Myxococcota bacterium]